MSIVVEDLYMAYGARVAVDRVSFTVDDRECFGIIGPNGAGKTTITESLVGLNQKYTGRVSVLGLDPRKDRKSLTRQVSIQLQESSYQDKLKVREVCQLFSSLYAAPADWHSLVERFGLVSHQTAYIAALSGGLQQRLSIVLALIARPKIVFLDELTTGLDPEARVTIWENLERLKAEESLSIFLTTHNLEEAHRLCDRVAILFNGRIIALDTPAGLIESSGVKRRVTIDLRSTPSAAVREDVTRLAASMREEGDSLIAEYDREAQKELLTYLVEHDTSFEIHEPTLEDAYFGHIGRAKQ